MRPRVLNSLTPTSSLKEETMPWYRKGAYAIATCGGICEHCCGDCRRKLWWRKPRGLARLWDALARSLHRP